MCFKNMGIYNGSNITGFRYRSTENRYHKVKLTLHRRLSHLHGNETKCLELLSNLTSPIFQYPNYGFACGKNILSTSFKKCAKVIANCAEELLN